MHKIFSKILSNIPVLTLDLNTLIYNSKKIALNQNKYWNKITKFLPYVLIIISKIVLNVFVLDEELGYVSMKFDLLIFGCIAFSMYVILWIVATLFLKK